MSVTANCSATGINEGESRLFFLVGYRTRKPFTHEGWLHSVALQTCFGVKVCEFAGMEQS